MNINKIFDIILDEIKKDNFHFDDKIDGRISSAINEDLFVKKIINISKENTFFVKNNIKIIAPNFENSNNREWFDFAIQTSNYFFPVNIKITDLEKNTADNLNSKAGIFWALTGKDPVKEKILSWENFFVKLDEKVDDNTKADYYFLIIDKKKIKNSFYSSLKSLKKITPNGNNLPFQAQWSKNQEKVKRTGEEARKFILNTLHESILRRCKILSLSNSIERLR